MEESIASFVKRSNADLLTFYTKDHQAHINDVDAKIICDLVTYHKSAQHNKLNLLIHSEGGNINAAIALIDFLKSRYTDGINSIVMVVAKSSGSFMAVCAKECYMHTGSILGDFTLDKRVSDKAYTGAQLRSTELAFAGICGQMDYKFWMSKFVFNAETHGQAIPKVDLLSHGYVKKLSQFHCRTKALGHLHNEIMDEFAKKPVIKKVYGLNEFLYMA